MNMSEPAPPVRRITGDDLRAWARRSAAHLAALVEAEAGRRRPTRLAVVLGVLDKAREVIEAATRTRRRRPAGPAEQPRPLRPFDPGPGEAGR